MLATTYKNFVGDYATDAGALVFIQTANWDDAGDGTGNPRIGMLYFNTTSELVRRYTSSGWVDVGTDLPHNTIYVDVNNTRTGQDGSFRNPFSLAQDAIDLVDARADNSLANPYVIELFVGDYTAQGALDLSKPNLVNLIIKGQGDGTAMPANSVQVAGLSCTTNNDGFLSLSVIDVYFTELFHMEGASNSTLFMSWIATIERCSFNASSGNCLYLYNMWGIRFRNCYMDSKDTDILNVYSVYFDHTINNSDTTFNADNASKSPIAPGFGVCNSQAFSTQLGNNLTFLNTALFATHCEFFTCTIGSTAFVSAMSLPNANTTVVINNSEVIENINVNGGSMVVNGTWYDPAKLTVLAGTFTNNNLSQAVAYTPAVPGDWSVVPDDVKEALDTLAANFAATITVLAKFTANDSLLPAVNPASISGRNGIPVAEFDDTINENIVFSDIVQKGYSGSNIEVKIYWVAASAILGDVKWNAAFERKQDGGSSIDVDSFAAARSVTDTTSAVLGSIKVSTITFTQAQADGIVSEDKFRVKFTRDASDVADTLIGDAQIVAVEIGVA